jgi:hypothetical protein
MKRTILAFIAGFVGWVLVVSVLDRCLRIVVAGYAAAEPRMAFTLGMMLARLSIAAITSLIAGAVVMAIAPTSPRVPWALGVVLLAVFVPEHVRLWSLFPLWYHLTFLLTLVPLVLLGARLTQAAAAARPDASSASS